MKELPDLLCRGPQTYHDAIFGVMGIPLRFQTNSAYLYTRAIEAFARFGPPTRETPVLTMRLFAHDVHTPLPKQTWPVVTRAQGDYHYVTWGPCSTVMAHMTAGFLFGFLCPEAQGWPTLVREAFIQTPVYYTLTRHGYIPLNLAILLWRGRYPLYLAAAPGTGKSTLVYACVRAGWRLVAEDLVEAVRTPRGWHFLGVPWWVHLAPDAVSFFPELEGATAAPQVGGTWKLVLDVEDIWPGSTETHAGPGPLVLLQRHAAQHSDYDWVEPDELLRAHTFFPFQEEDWLLNDVREVATYLAERGSYMFDIGSDLDEAVSLLEELAHRHYRREL